MAFLVAAAVGAITGYIFGRVASPDFSVREENFAKLVAEAEKTEYVSKEEVREYELKVKLKFRYKEEGNIPIAEDMFNKGLQVNSGKICFKEIAADLDNATINEMVEAAKNNAFDKVWPILDEKPYIVNCIPEKRAWSVLHQAIFHGNFNAVKTLVEDYWADIGVFTKIDRERVAKPGTDALSLAKQLQKDTIFNFLKHHAAIAKRFRKGEDFSYFVQHPHDKIYPFANNPLLRLTLASYRSTFFNDSSYYPDPKMHTAKIMQVILKSTSSTWRNAKPRIRNTLCGIDRGEANYLLQTKTREEFFGKIIMLYTEQSVYHHLAPAFSRQAEHPYLPLATDLSVGPYASMLNAILLYWGRLESYSGVTYRGVNENVCQEYTKNETILFRSFVSSSKDPDKASSFRDRNGTMFIFDNSVESKFRPRYIRPFSSFPYEEECLFPMCAEFKVTSVETSSHTVCLKLLDPTT